MSILNTDIEVFMNMDLKQDSSMQVKRP